MLKKRGISGVVAAVLLILLVIVAVVIVWASIRPLVIKSNKETNTNCLLVQLEPRLCRILGGEANVTVFRGPREGVALSGMKFIFDEGVKVVDLNSSAIIYNNNVKPNLLEMKTYTINLTELDFMPSNFNVVAVIGPSNDKKTCNLITTEVNCI